MVLGHTPSIEDPIRLNQSRAGRPPRGGGRYSIEGYRHSLRILVAVHRGPRLSCSQKLDYLMN
jgi:hypothetical protein